GSRVVVATDQGVFVRSDTGWVGPFFGGSRISAITATGNRAFAALNSGIYVSDDGVNWLLIPGSSSLPKDVNVLAADGGFVYVGTNGGSILASPLFTRRRSASH